MSRLRDKRTDITGALALSSPCPSLVFRRPEPKPGRRIEQTKVIVNQLDTVDIFSGDDGRLSRALIRDHAAQMHDPVAHGDAKLRRLPFILHNGRDHAAADVAVVGSRIRNVSSKACDGTEQVSPRYNSDQGRFSHNRHTLDVVPLHHSHQFLERRVLGHGAEIVLRHDLADLATVLTYE